MSISKSHELTFIDNKIHHIQNNILPKLNKDQQKYPLQLIELENNYQRQECNELLKKISLLRIEQRGFTTIMNKIEENFATQRNFLQKLQNHKIEYQDKISKEKDVTKQPQIVQEKNEQTKQIFEEFSYNLEKINDIEYDIECLEIFKTHSIIENNIANLPKITNIVLSTHNTLGTAVQEVIQKIQNIDSKTTDIDIKELENFFLHIQEKTAQVKTKISEITDTQNEQIKKINKDLQGYTHNKQHYLNELNQLKSAKYQALKEEKQQTEDQQVLYKIESTTQ